jgi:hypothetical protein
MANGALVHVKPALILQRYLAGELTSDIAKSLGVTRQGLDYHLRTHAEQDWRDAQVILAFERKHVAQEAMDVANDVLSLARAREQLKSAQWDLERLLKRLFGPSAEVTGADGGPLQVQVVRYSSETIEQRADVAVQTPEIEHLDKG